MKKNLLKTVALLAALLPMAWNASAQPYKTDEIRDLALIYQGGTHRLDWTVEDFRPHVVHTYSDGSRDWFFDGFLFLEFKTNHGGRNYTVGYEKTNARRQEWEWLLDRIFEQDKALDALNKCIAEEKQQLGKPTFRHKVVLGLPEAIRNQKDWGELNGRTMDFSNDVDQVDATKWYIDQLVKRFKAAKLKNLDLAGFYWVAEDTHHCGTLTLPLSDYIHKLGYKFYWIPYWTAKGAADWKELGFDIAYQQPNHFFSKDIPDSRLDDACKFARANGMAMEFEFDDKASANHPDSSHDRMAAYINHFEQNDVFNTSAIAYYCGGRGVLTMRDSKNPKDHALMDRLARLVRMRRYLETGYPVKCKTRIVAHRGNWRPEGSAQNSIASIHFADQLGVYGIEFDVWMAADSVIMLNHDGWHKGYKVQTTPSTILRTLTLENGEPMPTLDEYLDVVAKTKMQLILEQKFHDTPEQDTAAAEIIVRKIHEHGLDKRTTYITFSAHAMRELIRLAPAGTEVLFLGNNVSPQELDECGAAGADYNYWVYRKNPEWLQYLRDKKMVTNIWTVDHPLEMMQVIDDNMDFITTNRPELFQKLTRRKK